MKASARQALNSGDTETRVGLRSRHLGHPRRSNFLAEPKIPTLLPPAASDSASNKLKEKKPGSRNKTRSLVAINPTAEQSTYRTQNSVRTTPATSVALAAREQVRQGLDPTTEKKIAKAKNLEAGQNTFEVIAKEWVSKHAGSWTESYSEKVRGLLHANLTPRIGSIPISRITAVMLVDAVRPIEARGAVEQAARALRWAKAICRYAVATGRLTSSPLADVLATDILEPRRTRSHPHLTAAELGDFLRQLHDYQGRPETRIAVQLLLLTFVRTGELRAAQWNEFDLDRQEWCIPAERMKMRAPHWVPLSTRATTLLQELREFSGYSAYLFPNHGKHPYMSENTINKAIAGIGYKGRVVGHGFRATASTILNESGRFSPDVIERQLAHKEQNEVRAAYHRSEYRDERKKLMQWWAEFLDAKQRGGEVVVLGRSA